jgi:bifunctional oligoribonuclease and PAP phosphatase NrnA
MKSSPSNAENSGPEPAGLIADVSGASAEPVTAAEPIVSILDVLQRGERFLVCSHARPDGDAVGSMLALGMTLAQLDKQVDMVSADRLPELYRLLPGAAGIRVVDSVNRRYDAVILLECDGLERAGIKGLDASFLINIDHHFSGRKYAQLNWIDQQAASVGEMVYRLIIEAGAHITPEMAECLYTTLLTDTGGFTYGSVDASTFEMARTLATAGADPVKIAQRVCYSAPASKMLLLGVALQHLRREGRTAWLWITHQDMVRTCAAEEDCEGIVNFAVGIADIEAAAFLRELPDGHVRVSLRSKGKLNVAILAERLGGGGHKNAAGCTLDGPLARSLEEIPAMLRAAVASATDGSPD